MRLSVAALLLAIAPCASAALSAQPQAASQPQPQTRATPAPLLPEATGTVTGHVIFADSNRPARFARVSLQPVLDVAKDPGKASPQLKAINLTSDAPPPPSSTTSVETSRRHVYAHQGRPRRLPRHR